MRAKVKRMLSAILLLIIASWSSFYDLLQQQCQRNEERRGQWGAAARPARVCEPRKFLSKSPLEKLEANFKHHKMFNRILLLVYTYSLAKSIIIIMLGFEYFADYHLIDCFILGRFRYIGRFTLVGPIVMVVISVNLIAGRLFASYFLKCSNFSLFEFLLHDRELVKTMEQKELELSCKRLEASASLLAAVADQKLEDFEKHYTRMFGSQHSEGHRLDQFRQANDIQAAQLDGAFFVENSCASDERMGVRQRQEFRWFLRPNRSLRCWDLMTNYCARLMVSMFFCYFGYCSLLCFLLGGQLFSNLGYEVAYPRCVRFLRRAQAAPRATNAPIPYEWIYVPSRSNISTLLGLSGPGDGELSVDDIPFIIPIRGWPQTNSWFAVLRLVWDLVENYLWDIECSIFFVNYTFMVYSFSFDIILNVQSIREQLVAIVERLRRNTSMGLHKGPANQRELATSSGEEQPRQQQHHTRDTSEILRVQAILVDHFELIQGYSVFISNLFMLYASLMFVQFFAAFAWISTVESRALEREFLVAQGAVFLVAVWLFTGIAITRSYNFKLYPLISSAMALDATNSVTKTRWTTIIKYYYPKPMYCFTFLKHSELSWMFFWKLFAWFVSAYLVLANFYYMKRI